ncbi:MAG: NAD(P)/FAD-dependent oxidoreductase, partial [Deltaproteobacteria bacterium]|nr:NAD(P)/FAD-dependent oxidoreductase [Deltaproteobacteria bacterium]
MAEYDAIVIGAGNGGLTAAATLAQRGVNVLLLERHNIPGGCATSFCRGRFEFEVSLHQLSGLGSVDKPGPLRATLDRLGIMDKLEFVQMQDLYRVIVPGHMDITLKPDLDEMIHELQKRFPHEKEGISAYFDFLYKLFTQVIGVFYFKDQDASREKYPLYYQYALKTAGEVMNRFIHDPLLQAAVSPYWTYMGLPPKYMSIVDMAAMFFAYLEFKPYHLKGGSQALSNALADTIIKNGGTIRFNCGAKKIIIKQGAVQGVITDKGEEIAAKYVISNASKISTYTEMMDMDQVPDEVTAQIKQCSVSQSAFTLYMGLDCEPEAVGLTQSTNFILGGTDPENSYRRVKVRDINDEDSMVLSCYNLIDPDFSPRGTCQVAMVTLKY